MVKIVETVPLRAWIPPRTVKGKVSSTELVNWLNANERDERISSDPPPPPPPPPPPGSLLPIGFEGNFILDFQEEFDGPELNRTVWNDNWFGSPGQITKPVNSDEIGAYDSAQVSIKDGCLELAAVAAVPKVTATDGKQYDYKSGLINSANKKDFVFGIFEARVFMPASAAGKIPYNWPAAWLNGYHTANNWPDRGENDIMENLSGGPAWHYHSKAGNTTVNNGKTIAGDWTGWHIYACEWAPGRIDYKYDGVLVGSQTTGVLNYPNYIVLNNGISTVHGGPLSVPQTMKVSHFRVWKRV